MSCSSPKDLAEFFRKRNIGGPQTEIKTNDLQTPEIEENTGHDFPGMQFECMIEKTFKEVDRTQSFSFRYDLIVAEISTNESPFIFKYNTNPGAFGKCESCYQTAILKVQCLCKKVSYCDLQCKKKDERYHLPNCDYENSVDVNTLTFDQQPDARKGVVGLQNLGNTCFMNSAL